jgi:hypothetical protein
MYKRDWFELGGKLEEARKGRVSMNQGMLQAFMESFGPSTVDPSGPAFGTLDEAGFSRALAHMSKGGFAVVTAFRKRPGMTPEKELETNRSQNRQLLGTLNSKKLGPVLTTGHWDEAPEGMNWKDAKSKGLTTHRVEDSFLVPKPDSMSVEEFEAIMHAAGNAYDQDAVLVGEKDKAWLIFKDGGKDQLGSTSVGKIGQGYSNMRGQPNRKWTFEGTATPSGAMSSMAFHTLGLKWMGEQGLCG